MCVTNALISDNKNGADVPKAPATGITQLFLDTYVVGLYSGIITEHNLSLELYTSVGDYLEAAVVNGFGKFEDAKTAELFVKLKQNVWHFGAAKQYQQNRTILKSFVAPLEQVPFEDFKAVADPILENYNKNWLRTEWNTSVSNSQSARDWNNLMEDDTIEFIEYITQEDVLVRASHGRLNGARYPKGHSFWNSYFPPNGFNCRCFTANHDEDTTQKTIKTPPEFGVADDMPKMFGVNPGKQQIIFPNSHPYFRVAQGDKIFREANYGMPL